MVTFGDDGKKQFLRNWGRSEMITTQHEIVLAKAYWSYVEATNNEFC